MSAHRHASALHSTAARPDHRPGRCGLHGGQVRDTRPGRRVRAAVPARPSLPTAGALASGARLHCALPRAAALRVGRDTPALGPRPPATLRVAMRAGCAGAPRRGAARRFAGCAGPRARTPPQTPEGGHPLTPTRAKPYGRPALSRPLSLTAGVACRLLTQARPPGGATRRQLAAARRCQVSRALTRSPTISTGGRSSRRPSSGRPEPNPERRLILFQRSPRHGLVRPFSPFSIAVNQRRQLCSPQFVV